jgi:hypothetical protein
LLCTKTTLTERWVGFFDLLYRYYQLMAVFCLYGHN